MLTLTSAKMHRSDDNVILVESDDDDDSLTVVKDDSDVVFVDMTPIPLRPARIKPEAFLSTISIESDEDDEDIIFVSSTKSKAPRRLRLHHRTNSEDIITIAPLETDEGSIATSVNNAVSQTARALDSLAAGHDNDASTFLNTPKLPSPQPNFEDDPFGFGDATSTLNKALSGTTLTAGDSGMSFCTDSDSKSMAETTLSSLLSSTKPLGGDLGGGGTGWDDAVPTSPQGLLAWLSDNTSCYSNPSSLTLDDGDSQCKDAFSKSAPCATSHSSSTPSEIAESFTKSLARLLSTTSSSSSSTPSSPILGCLQNPLINSQSPHVDSSLSQPSIQSTLSQSTIDSSLDSPLITPSSVSVAPSSPQDQPHGMKATSTGSTAPTTTSAASPQSADPQPCLASDYNTNDITKSVATVDVTVAKKDVKKDVSKANGVAIKSEDVTMTLDEITCVPDTPPHQQLQGDPPLRNSKSTRAIFSPSCDDILPDIPPLATKPLFSHEKLSKISSDDFLPDIPSVSSNPAPTAIVKPSVITKTHTSSTSTSGSEEAKTSTSTITDTLPNTVQTDSDTGMATEEDRKNTATPQAAKRAVSFMHSHPNSIPLKKRRRQRATGGRLSLDSVAPKVNTDSKKCSWCKLTVCFSQLSYCMQGHGCCDECLQHRAKTLLSKSKRGSLKCPYTGCDSYFSISQLQRTLPRMVVEILEEKLDREYINYAADLVWENIGESSTKKAETGNDRTTATGVADEEDEEEEEEEETEVIEDAPPATPKEPGLGSLPVYWDTMDDNSTYKLVDLATDNIEFHEIRCLFELTMKNQAKIQKIYRIQNPILWQFYNVKKMQMAQEDGGQPVSEMRLCHGTSNGVVEAICKTNFDWRLCGAHGTMYGQGTYFARDASYSHVYTDNGRNRGVHRNPRNKMAALLYKKNKYAQKYAGCQQLFKVLGGGGSQGGAGVPTSNTATSNSNTAGGGLFCNSLTMLQPPPAHFKPMMIPGPPGGPGNGGYGPAAMGVSVVPIPMSQMGQNPILGLGLPYMSLTQPNHSTLMSQVLHRHFQIQSNHYQAPAHPPAPPAHSRPHNLPGRQPLTTTLLNGNETACPTKKPVHSMFIAKVMVGRYTTGHTQYRKPPPLNYQEPYGRSYDACVDNVMDPKIYVVFDSSQCYPEYLIEYTSNSSGSI